MNTKMKMRMLSLLLCFVMLVGLMPTTVFAAGDGTSEATAIEVTDYASFKAAMEDPAILFVKISNTLSSTISSETGNLIVGASVSSNKTLIVNADATFTASGVAGKDIVDSLIQTVNGASLTIKGTGTLRFKANGNNSFNAVVRIDGGTVYVQDSVTLHGTYNNATYGCAILNQNGNLNLWGGTLKGEAGYYTNPNYLGAVDLRGGNTVINGNTVVIGNKYSGNSSAGEYPEKLVALTVEDDATLAIYEGAVNLTEGVTINNDSVSIAFADSKVTSDYLMSGIKMFRASTHEALATNYSKVHDSVYFAQTPANLFAVQPTFQIVSEGNSGTVSFTMNGNYTYSAVQLVKESGVADDEFATNHAGVHFSNTANVYTATEYKGDGTYQTPEGNYKIAVQISGEWYYSNVFAINYGGGSSSTINDAYVVQPTFQIVSEGNSGTVSFTMNGNYTYSAVQLVKENGVADDEFATNHAGVHFSNTANVYTATEYKGDGTYQTPEGNYKIAVQISGEWYYSNVFAINYGGGSSSTINDAYVVQPTFQIESEGNSGTVSFTLNENYTYSAVQLVKENGVADDSFATAHAGVHFSNTANVYTATEYKGDGTYQTPEGNYKIAVQISGDWYYSNVFAISYGTVQPTEYIVSYNANGGSGTMVGDMVEENGKFTLENCTYIAPEGYKFKAWAIGSVNGEQKQPGEQITITAETYIYAIWEAVEYNVTVTGGTASVGAGTPITKATMGTTVTLIAGQAPAGQEFDKWVVNGVVVADANSATTTFVMPAGNVTAEATYKDIPVVTYTVTFDANGGTGSMADATGVSGDYVLPVCGFTAPNGKQFKAWSVGGVEKAAGETITVNANTTVTAVWEDIPVTYYTVTFDSNGGSAVTAQTIEEGQKATKPADPTKDGYDFKGWTLNGSAYDFNAAVNGNITLVATWEQQQVVPTVYTVTFDSNGGSAVTAQTIEEGQKATKPADPTKDGYDFKGWTLNGSAYDFNAAVNGNITLVATWEQKQIAPTTYTVSFAANGGTGTMADVTGISGEYTLPENGFTAPDGKQFKAWSVGGAEKAVGDKITVTADTTVTAVWETIPAGHTCNIKPVAKVDPSCTEGGKEAYYKCEGCGKFYEDALGAKEITDLAAWGNIAKNGHTESDWKSDKDNHWKECTVAACGVIIENSKAAHADANNDGKCDTCEYNVGTTTTNPDDTNKPDDTTKPEDTNKPSDDVQSPQTGDNSMMWLWVALLFVSGFGVVATTVIGKKKSSAK